jgi:GTPase SAR1 family protein
MNVVYEAPSSMAPYIPPVSDHIFLPHFPSWQTLVKERLNESIDRYTFQFTYLEDFHINDELMSRVLGKMNLSSQERQELFTLHQERHSITSSGHDRNLLSTSISNAQYQSTLPHSKSGVEHLNLFSSLRISIRIEYFSLLDYQNYNRLWIESNWTVNHVITFLRLTSLSFDLEDLFLENEIDGRGLLQLALPVEMMIPLPKIRETVKRMEQKLNEEKMRVFRSKVLKLGSIDYLELLRDVMQEEGRVRAENEKKLEEMTMVRSQFRKQQQQQHNNPNTHQHNSQQQQHTVQTQRTQHPCSAVSSPATPATTVYKFSQLASPNSSAKTRDNVSSPAAAVTSPGTPIASYSQEEEDRNHHHQQLQQSPSSPSASLSTTPRKPQQQEQVTSSRVARGDTLFSEGIFEVVMVGEGAVGKTSLMNRICRDEFHAVEKPTIGTKLLQHALEKLVLDVWDTGGQPAQYATMKARAKRADVILAVYDVSNRDSLIALKDILEDLYQIGLCLLSAIPFPPLLFRLLLFPTSLLTSPLPRRCGTTLGMQPWAAVVLIGNKADVMTPLRQVELCTTSPLLTRCRSLLKKD